MASIQITEERYEDDELGPLIDPSTSTEDNSSNKTHLPAHEASSVPSSGGGNGIRGIVQIIVQHRLR